MYRRSSRKIFWFFILPFVVYFSLYTWNWRTGILDRFATKIGLEYVGWILVPGEWIQKKSTSIWDRYLYLVDVTSKNAALNIQLHEMRIEMVRLKEEAAQAERLRYLFSFAPPHGWTFQGTRVMAHRLGPNAGLDTILLDKGLKDGLTSRIPVVTPEGVLGRVLRVSEHFSTVLLITDPNSRIAVVCTQHRTPGILVGSGSGEPLRILYVPLNAAMNEGDILLTSGLAGIFPKGLPVARITKIVRSNASLFKEIWAEPLVSMKKPEEVLLLFHHPASTGEDEGNGPIVSLLKEG